MIKKYPIKVTENFDEANFNLIYSLSFIKKYFKGDVLEIGAGCGSFTRHYLDLYKKKISSITLTDTDKNNFSYLSKKFKKKKLKILNTRILKIRKKYDLILYLHVLEHIKNDKLEIKYATKILKKNGKIIILTPAHMHIYSNLDRLVGHYRRYDKKFFKKKFKNLKLLEFKFLDSMGYILYFLNRLIFKKEKFPSKLKIFIWDKFFIPITSILDLILSYKFGKCILAVYRKV